MVDQLKPRGAYEPLTEQRIEELRGVIIADRENWPSKAYGAEVERLCNMAVNCLLYGAEIDRLRSAPLKLDTDTHVFFYEQDHYYLSNFSSFRILWRGLYFHTSEAAYHYERFERGDVNAINYHQTAITLAMSAHEAFRYAQEHKADQRANWDDEKVGVMKMILTAKAQQHEYVRRKLLQTGDKILVENSWRDPFWGWGPNRDGKNMLGKLWMVVRAELSAKEKP